MPILAQKAQVWFIKDFGGGVGQNPLP